MLEMTTVNALGTGWVDNIPAAVSTGYQAQNVASEAARIGVDTIKVVADALNWTCTLKQGGTIDENGILYTLKDDFIIDPILTGDDKILIFVLVADSLGSQNRIINAIMIDSFEVFAQLGYFEYAKNAYYFGGGRVLNTYLEINYTDKNIVVKNADAPQYGTLVKNFPASKRSDLVNVSDLWISSFMLEKHEKSVTLPTIGGTPKIGGYGKYLFFLDFVYTVNDEKIRKLDISTGVSTTFTTLSRTSASISVCARIVGGNQVVGEVSSAGTVTLFKSGGIVIGTISGLSVTSIDIDSSGNLWTYSQSLSLLRKHVGLTASITNDWQMNPLYSDITLCSDVDLSDYGATGFSVYKNTLPVGSEIVCASYQGTSNDGFGGSTVIHTFVCLQNAKHLVNIKTLYGADNTSISFGGVGQIYQINFTGSKVISKI